MRKVSPNALMFFKRIEFHFAGRYVLIGHERNPVGVPGPSCLRRIHLSARIMESGSCTTELHLAADFRSPPKRTDFTVSSSPGFCLPLDAAIFLNFPPAILQRLRFSSNRRKQRCGVKNIFFIPVPRVEIDRKADWDCSRIGKVFQKLLLAIVHS